MVKVGVVNSLNYIGILLKNGLSCVICETQCRSCLVTVVLNFASHFVHFIKLFSELLLIEETEALLMFSHHFPPLVLAINLIRFET